MYDGKRAQPVITKLGENLFRAGRAYEGPGQSIWVIRKGYPILSNQPYNDDGFAVWSSAQQKLLSTDSILNQTGLPFRQASLEAIAGTDENDIVFLLSDGRILTFDGQSYHELCQVQLDTRCTDFYTVGQTLLLTTKEKCLAIDLPDRKERQPQIRSLPLLNHQPCRYQCDTKDSTTRIQFYNLPGEPTINIPKLAEMPLAVAYTPKQLLWIVTSNEIAVYAPAPGKPAARYEKVTSSAVNLSASVFQELRVDHEQQQAWIASADGVILIQLKLRWFEPFYSFQDSVIDPRGFTSDPHGVLYFIENWLFKYDTMVTVENKDIPTCLHLRYEDGKLWCSHFSPRITQINLKDQKLTTFEYSQQKPLDATTWTHRSSHSGELFVGSTRGLLHKSATADTLAKVTTKTPADEAEIRYIHENQAGLWLCTTSGLFLYDEEADTCLSYQFVTGQTALNHLYESPDGSFWLATFGQGLYHWQPDASGTADQYNYQKGFSDEQILAVYADQKGFLWMPTNYGLIRFHPDRQQLYTFTTADGLPNNEFNLYSHHQMDDGTLVFGTVAGIIKFDPLRIPEGIENTAKVQPTSIEKIKPDNQLQSIPLEVSSVRLRPSGRQLNIQFVLLDYSSKEMEHFDYRLIGQSNQWVPMQRSTLELSSIPPGQFTLEVRGRKGKEAYSSSVYRLSINVPPPFYQTAWFILTSVAALVLSSFLFFRWRTQRLRRERLELQKEVQKRTQKIQQQAVALQKMSQIKTTLITNIAHELRTPLTMSSGALQLLRSGQHPKPESGLRTIEHNNKRLIHLITQLVDVNKEEKGLLKLQIVPTDLKKLLQTIHLSYEDSAVIQQIDYQMHLDERLAPSYLADPIKVEYILHNLLSNAFKFTPKGGSITCSVAPSQNRPGIGIEVKDTGPGIPEALQPRIFERFFQADSTAGGMGIGLAIVKDYVAAMDGEVQLESSSGAGTLIRLYLPFHPATTDITATAATQPENSYVAAASRLVDAEKEKPYILIVEDNPEVQALLILVFQHQYELATASNGQEALDHLRHSGRVPALVITDLMMPKVDGITFIKKLKADKQLQLVPILVISAKNDPLFKIKVLHIGVDDYVQKPFNVEELRAIASTLLKNSAARLKVQTVSQEQEEATGVPLKDKESKQHEKEWLGQVEQVLWEMVDKGMEMKIKDLAQELHTSERQLQRQIKQLTGLTPLEYINEVRLQKARQLISEGAYSTVSEIAYRLGYAYPNYFSRVFTKRFGQPPSHFFKD